MHHPLHCYPPPHLRYCCPPTPARPTLPTACLQTVQHSPAFRRGKAAGQFKIESAAAAARGAAEGTAQAARKLPGQAAEGLQAADERAGEAVQGTAQAARGAPARAAEAAGYGAGYAQGLAQEVGAEVAIGKGGAWVDPRWVDGWVRGARGGGCMGNSPVLKVEAWLYPPRVHVELSTATPVMPQNTHAKPTLPLRKLHPPVHPDACPCPLQAGTAAQESATSAASRAADLASSAAAGASALVGSAAEAVRSAAQAVGERVSEAVVGPAQQAFSRSYEQAKGKTESRIGGEAGPV